MTTGDGNEFLLQHNLTGVQDPESAKEALRASEEQYRVAFERALDAIIIADPSRDGRVLSANPAACRMFGYSPEEFTGLNRNDIIDTSDANFISLLERRKQLGQASAELTYKRKDGTRFAGEINSVLYQEKNGEQRSLAIIRDITERKRTEEALRESESRYRRLHESIRDGFVYVDMSGRIIEFNEPYRQMLGYERNELESLSYHDLTPERWHAVEQTIVEEQILPLGYSQVYEKEYRKKDGTIFPVELRTILIKDENGKNQGMWATVRDISGRKRAEAALQNANEELQVITEELRQQNDELLSTQAELRSRSDEIETLLAVSPIAIFVAYDPNCVRITGNPAAYQLVEMSGNPNANLSKSAAEYERPAYRVFRDGVEVSEENLPMQKAARLGMEIMEDVLELRFEDGSQKFIYTYAKPLFDSQGKTRGAIAAILDITERKRVEEQLEHSNQKLNEILESIQDDFYVLNREWKFVFTSRSFTARLGKAPRDFVGNNIWEMFPKHVGTTYEENLRAAMEKGETRRFEIPGKYTNAWYRMTVFPSPEGVTVLGMDITERKRAEEQLHYQATILSNVNDAIVASDAEFRITVWNAAAEILYGWKAEEVIGRNGLETVHTEWPEQDANVMRQTIAKTGRWRGEATQVRRDGTRFPVEVSSLVLYDENGQIIGYVSVNRDITERKRIEAELRASEERYRHLVQYAPTGIYEIDIKTMRFIEVNDSMCQILGYTRQELMSMMPDELLDEEGRKRFRERMFRTLAGGTISEETEYKVRARDGREIWGALNVSVNYEDGKAKSVSVIAHDVTERKRTEQALAQAMQELQAHIDNSPLAIVAFDPEYRVTEWSAGAQRMFGWEAEEVLNKKITEMPWVHEDDAQRVADLSADMLAGRASSNIHANRNYRKDGSVIECEWYNSALVDANGKLISVRSQVLEVTKRKRAEEALRENQATLQSFYDSAPFMMGIMEVDGDKSVLISGNRAMADFFGKPLQNMIGRPPTEFGSPEYLERLWIENYRKSQRQGAPVQFEFQYPLAHTTRWFRATVSFTGVAPSGYPRFSFVTEDITERKRARDALEEKELQLELLNELLEKKVQDKTEEVRRLSSNLVVAVQRERQRLSHILHDDLQQRIYAIQMQLSFLRDGLAQENESARKEVSDIEKQLSEIRKITRDLSIDLNPPILPEEGLSHAIRWLAIQMRQQYGLPIEIEAHEMFVIPNAELHVLLFNCVRELLFNVVKHAKASRATVALQWAGKDLQIEVRDNGQGFPVKTPDEATNSDVLMDDGLPRSLGLPNIRYQLSLFGGSTEIYSEAGAGARVILVVPVTEVK